MKYGHFLSLVVGNLEETLEFLYLSNSTLKIRKKKTHFKHLLKKTNKKRQRTTTHTSLNTFRNNKNRQKRPKLLLHYKV